MIASERVLSYKGECHKIGGHVSQIGVMYEEPFKGKQKFCGHVNYYNVT